MTKLLRDIPRNSNHVVCKKCHTKLWNNCIIECILCANNTFRKSMIVFIKKDIVLVYIIHLQMANFMGTRCIYVKLGIEIFRTNLCVCHVAEELQRKCVKFTRKMNMILDNLLFSSVLVTVFMKLGVHIFVCHVTLHLQRLILQIQLSHIM